MTKSGIAVAVDGSAESDAAVRWAAREALLREANVTLVHVVAPVVVTWPVGYLARVMPNGRKKTRSMSSNRHRRSFRREVGNETVPGQDPSTSRLSRSRPCRGVPGCGDDRRRQPRPGCDRWDIAGFRQPQVVAPCPLSRRDHSRERSRSRQHSTAPCCSGSTAHRHLRPPRPWRSTKHRVDTSIWSRYTLGVDVGIPPVLGMEWDEYEGQGHEVLAERLAGWQEQYPDVQHAATDRLRPAGTLVDRRG